MDQTQQLNKMTELVGSWIPGDKFDGLAGLLIALAVIVLGYFISRFAGMIVAGAINKTGIGKKAKSTGGNIGKSISKAVFWVLWLVFILLGLGQFPMVAEQLGPIQGMLDSIFKYIPNIFGSAIILAVGVMLSKVVKEALSSTLEAAQVDNLAARYGFAGADDAKHPNGIARSLGSLAAAVVVIFSAIGAIENLKIEAFSTPIKGMLNTVLDYIPSILAATLILAVSVFIARFVSRLVQSTLPALGVDDSLKSIASLDGSTSTSVVPSKVIGTIAFVGILLMGLTAAMNALNIPQLTNVFDTLLGIGGRVVLGAIIIGAGLFIANFVSRIVAQTSGNLAANIIKYATMIIVTFMGLSQMKLGDQIVNSAFEYTVMAAAVAGGVGGAIAFGLGGREWAAKKLNEWWPSKTGRKK